MENNRIYTIKEIEKMSYVEFVAFINEENRPSGGKKSIRLIAQNAFVNSCSEVLEIGSTNGFSSIEIARLTGCSVVGIDIDKNSVHNANKKAMEYGLTDRVMFYQQSALNLPFPDNSFDLIICGNALSFINNDGGAMKEILRVTKPNGFISIVPIWYYEEIDDDIVRKVSNILGFNIKCTRKSDWMGFAQKYDLENYYCADFGFENKTDLDINNYVESMISSKVHLAEYDINCLNLIKSRWKAIMTVFNQNLQMTRYSIMLFRKNEVIEEQELFSSYQIN